eukprot:COSAG01_NODE_3666_length_5799_cov_5.810957_5_plen_49_part_00
MENVWGCQSVLIGRALVPRVAGCTQVVNCAGPWAGEVRLLDDKNRSIG